MVDRFRLGYALAGAFLVAAAIMEVVGTPVALLVGRFLTLGVFVGLILAWFDVRAHSPEVARRCSLGWTLLVVALVAAMVVNRFAPEGWWNALADLPGVLLTGAAFVLFLTGTLEGPRRLVPYAGLGAHVASNALVLVLWSAIETGQNALVVLLTSQGLHAMGNLLFGVAFLWASRRGLPLPKTQETPVSDGAREPLSFTPVNRKR